METITFRCGIEFNIPSKPLNFKIVLDGNTIYETDDIKSYTNPSSNSSGFTSCNPNVSVVHEFEENNDDHELNFYLSGKTDSHTTLDNNGSVISSAQVTLSDIRFDEINLTQMLLSNDDLMSYTHDHNGDTSEITQVFDPTMGFNGVSTLKFKTPIYLWLLEHM
jgi:hypothetical protein